jgi:1-aminocyclopropane-1-carboxylate deaminase/D-cysteine desulfhydrase-like pyridoxal-dependent ACC family enzyme
MAHTIAELESAVAKLPRVPLAKLPTPLDELCRLGQHLGVRLFLKREDLTGLALGGNKTRMFEFLLGDAIAKGADVVVGGAAAQSNYCRQLAAACAALGLELHLLLREVRGPVDREAQGNLLLDLLFGAKVTLLSVPPAEQRQRMEARVEELRRAGRRPYFPQGEKYLGALSYIACAAELYGQVDAAGIRPDWLLTSAAGETQAGLLVGTKLLGRPTRVVGINPGVDWWDVPTEAKRFGEGAAERLGLPCTVEKAEVVNYSDYVGEGYGIPSPDGLRALALMARSEGILLDPVYTSKALAGLQDLIGKGVVRRGQTVVMMHTGGVPALFAYTDALEKAGLTRAEQH